MKKYFIIAGDPSGDIHAARLMAKIKKEAPHVTFVGIGGEKMKQEGLRSLANLSDISVVGFWEVAKRLRDFNKLLSECKNILLNGGFDAFIPVDYPGFNIRMASFATHNKIPVYYYIAPQLWAWGKDRARKLKGSVKKVLVVFPFEEKYFMDYDIDATFVGHPLLDDPDFEATSPIESREKLIGIFPGSRKQEIDKHAALIDDIAEELKRRLPEYRIGISKSPYIPAGYIEGKISEDLNVEIFEDSRKLMRRAAAGIVKTGTTNLEAALSGMPFAMFYKTSFITYALGKRKINLPYISLANILANNKIVKEFVQQDATSSNITKEIISLLTDKQKRDAQLDNFIEIRKILGESGASQKAAKIILNET